MEPTQPVSVGIVGPFSSGKSTLLNALIGEALQTMDVLPETSVLSHIAWGPERQGRIVFADGRTLDGEVEDVRQRVQKLEAEGSSASVDHIEFRLPLSFLRHMELWDTPGINANRVHHELVAERAIRRADVLLWVTPIDAAVARVEVERIVRRKPPTSPLLLVVNKIDVAEPDELDGALAAIREDLRGAADALYPTAALAALDRASGTQSEWSGDDGVAGLRTALVEIVGRAEAERDRVAAAPAVRLRPSEFHCPVCREVCDASDRFCVCGRELQDQHRRCPRCDEDNILRRERCRGCSVGFAAAQESDRIEGEAWEDFRRGDLTAAAAKLQLATETDASAKGRTSRRDALTRGTEGVQELITSARHELRAASACWRDEVSRIDAVLQRTMAAVASNPPSRTEQTSPASTPRVGPANAVPDVSELPTIHAAVLARVADGLANELRRPLDAGRRHAEECRWAAALEALNAADTRPVFGALGVDDARHCDLTSLLARVTDEVEIGQRRIRALAGIDAELAGATASIDVNVLSRIEQAVEQYPDAFREGSTLGSRAASRLLAVTEEFAYPQRDEDVDVLLKAGDLAHRIDPTSSTRVDELRSTCVARLLTSAAELAQSGSADDASSVLARMRSVAERCRACPPHLDHATAEIERDIAALRVRTLDELLRDVQALLLDGRVDQVDGKLDEARRLTDVAAPDRAAEVEQLAADAQAASRAWAECNSRLRVIAAPTSVRDAPEATLDDDGRKIDGAMAAVRVMESDAQRLLPASSAAVLRLLRETAEHLQVSRQESRVRMFEARAAAVTHALAHGTLDEATSSLARAEVTAKELGPDAMSRCDELARELATARAEQASMINLAHQVVDTTALKRIDAADALLASLRDRHGRALAAVRSSTSDAVSEAADAVSHAQAKARRRRYAVIATLVVVVLFGGWMTSHLHREHVVESALDRAESALAQGEFERAREHVRPAETAGTRASEVSDIVRRIDLCRVLTGRVHGALSEHDFTSARVHIDQAPNPGVPPRLREHLSALVVERERALIASKIDDALRFTAEAVRRDDLPAARSALADARSLGADESLCASLDVEIRTSEQRQKAARASEAMNKAFSALAQRQFRDAANHVGEARGLGADEQQCARLEMEIVAAERSHAAGQALAETETALNAGLLDAAETELERARSLGATAKECDALRRRLDDGRRQAELERAAAAEAARARLVTEAIRQFDVALQRAEFDAAETALERVRGLNVAAPTCDELRRRLDEGKRQAASAQAARLEAARVRAVADAIRQANAALESGMFDVALGALERARRLGAPANLCDDVQSRLNERKRLAETRARTSVIMMDLAAWDAATSEERRSAAQYVEQTNAGFQLLHLTRFSAGDESHEVAVFMHDRTALEFVLVPGGTYMMGSPTSEPSRSPNEDQRRVSVGAFLIARTECTEESFVRFVDLDRSSRAKAAPKHPAVERVTHYFSELYCERAGLALPSEAQWEWACRAGTTTTYAFGDEASAMGAFGNVLDAAALAAKRRWLADRPQGGSGWGVDDAMRQMDWSQSLLKDLPDASSGRYSSEVNDGYATSAPVASFRPNAFGIYDMHGNVSEWCADEFLRPSQVAHDPSLPWLRVLRGGSWASPVAFARSAVRAGFRESVEYADAGFRPAKSVVVR